MANFQISITNASGDKDVNSVANVVTIVDYSNYDSTEAGHGQSNFSDYYKITLTSYNGYSYIAYSRTGQDKQINAPSAEGSLPITNTLVNEEDDVHTVVLIALPTWNASVAYAPTAPHCVYYNGILYESILPGTNKNPATETTYWSVVTDANLPTKYRLSYTWAITYDMAQEFVINNYKANDETWDVYQKKIFDNKYFQFCAKMMLLFESIDINADEEAWTDIANTITKTKNLINEL